MSSEQFHVTEVLFCDVFLVANILLRKTLTAFFVRLLSEYREEPGAFETPYEGGVIFFAGPGMNYFEMGRSPLISVG